MVVHELRYKIGKCELQESCNTMIISMGTYHIYIVDNQPRVANIECSDSGTPWVTATVTVAVQKEWVGLKDMHMIT